MIGYYTGLRFSDYTELRPLNISFGGRILSVTTQKTAARIAVPLNPNVLEILDKYRGIPPLPCRTRSLIAPATRRYLKELGQVAGLTAPVKRTRTQGGIRSTLGAQKWELLHAHRPAFVHYKRIFDGCFAGIHYENYRHKSETPKGILTSLMVADKIGKATDVLRKNTLFSSALLRRKPLILLLS